MYSIRSQKPPPTNQVTEVTVAERVAALTPRQRQVMCGIANGSSNKEMAALLNLSVKTIETHRTELQRRMGMTTVDLVHAAIDSDEVKLPNENTYLDTYARLTPREKQVLGHVIEGKFRTVIAHELGISNKTVEKHREKIMKELGVHNLAELILAYRSLPPEVTDSVEVTLPDGYDAVAAYARLTPRGRQ